MPKKKSLEDRISAKIQSFKKADLPDPKYEMDRQKKAVLSAAMTCLKTYNRIHESKDVALTDLITLQQQLRNIDTAKEANPLYKKATGSSDTLDLTQEVQDLAEIYLAKFPKLDTAEQKLSPTLRASMSTFSLFPADKQMKHFHKLGIIISELPPASEDQTGKIKTQIQRPLALAARAYLLDPSPEKFKDLSDNYESYKHVKHPLSETYTIAGKILEAGRKVNPEVSTSSSDEESSPPRARNYSSSG